MTFRQFEYICALIHEGSFTKAAKELFISESALSQQISAIESEYGVKIINRKTKPLTLTKQGYAIYEAAVKILDIKRNMEEELEKGEQAKLYIKTIEFLSFAFIPRIMAALREKYPDAEMKIFDAETEHLFTGKYYENIDLYVHSHDMITSTEEINEKDDKFEHEEIGFERILLATSKNNPLLKKLAPDSPVLDLKALKNASFIGPTTSNYLEYICRKLCLERGGYEPQYTKAEPTIVKTLSYLQYNDCWAVLPDTVAKYYNLHADITFLNIKGGAFKRQVIAAYPKKTRLSPIARDCILIARELLKEEYFDESRNFVPNQ